jgi:2-polyprenyl-6-methoxyphenol hydroxylase-like FAD-dependent oxidoreductase
MYDAIVIGARSAGASTAMLLARKGFQVLLVDRATFPSDTPTGHYIHQSGVGRLARWGVLDRVIASGCPPVSRATLDVGDFALSGTPTATADGVRAGYAPRQFVLTQILVEAAVAAGAELRQGFSVEEPSFDGDRVTGIRGHAHGGASVTERAGLVVGADGRHSRFARSVEAPSYNERPSLTGAWWSYWSDVPVSGIALYMRPNRAVGVFPTNDGLTGVFTTVPATEVEQFRSDIAGSFARDLSLVPALAEEVRGGRQEEPFYGAIEMPNRFRRPYGPGWALVGDAGYHKDPLTAQGITDAFRDAELLADAVDAGFSGCEPLDEALAGYERRRNEAVMPMYELTCQLATLGPPPLETQQLMAALRGNQADTNQFLGAVAGTVPLPAFLAPENVQRILSMADRSTNAA